MTSCGALFVTSCPMRLASGCVVFSMCVLIFLIIPVYVQSLVIDSLLVESGFIFSFRENIYQHSHNATTIHIHESRKGLFRIRSHDRTLLSSNVRILCLDVSIGTKFCDKVGSGKCQGNKPAPLQNHRSLPYRECPTGPQSPHRAVSMVGNYRCFPPKPSPAKQRPHSHAADCLLRPLRSNCSKSCLCKFPNAFDASCFILSLIFVYSK